MSEITYMETGTAVYFDHNYGISMQNFTNFPKLVSFFDITSVAYTLQGVEFVSSKYVI